MLELKSVSYAIGRKTILENTSFKVGRGELIGMIGPSGSGKTTLLRLIAGLEAPTRGEIIAGARPGSPGGAAVEIFSAPGRIVRKPEDRKIGMVFQEPTLYPHLNVSENVGFGISAPDDRAGEVERLLALFRLEHLRTRDVHALSGGERQQVAVLRSLAAKPELLLLDEPLSNVDRLSRHDKIPLLAKVLRETGGAAMLVTHDIRDAHEFGVDSVLVLDGGQVKFHGSLDELQRQPPDSWTARFVTVGLGLTTETTR